MAVEFFIVPRHSGGTWQEWVRRSVSQFLAPLETWRRGADPLPQYLLVSDALAIFAFAAYGSMYMSTATPFPDLDASWQHITVFDTEGISRGVVMDATSDILSYDHDGAYAFAFTGSFAHDSSNQGRTTSVRIWDVTDGAQIGAAFRLGIGRNVEDSSFSLIILADITEAVKGHQLRLEIGGGDDVFLVEFTSMNLSTWNVGEWRDPIPSASQMAGEQALLTTEGDEVLTTEGDEGLTT